MHAAPVTRRAFEIPWGHTCDCRQVGTWDILRGDGSWVPSTQKRGRLGLGLFVGLCMLLSNAATGIVTGAVLGHAGEDLIARLPWALLFSLASGFMEELLFRCLFLRKLIPAIGVAGAIPL